MKNRIVSNSIYLVIILIGFSLSCSPQFADRVTTYKNDLLKEQTINLNNILEAKEDILGSYFNNADDFIGNSLLYSVRNLNINTVEDDFSPSIININNDEFNSIGIVFASAIGSNPNSLKYQKKNNNRPFMDMYYSYLNIDQSFSNPKLLENSFLWKFEDPRLNTDLHDGVVTFTNNGKKMYLTQNNDSLSSEDTLNLVIISYTESDGKWKKDDDKEFEYNNPEYNCAHPSISNDGNKLFFSSDMPNGLGGMDLYVRNKLSDGSWGVARNLGPGINTEENEIFPFINDDNSLYFASDGHKGLGGLDIYKTTYNNIGKWSFPVNMSKPVNSPFDDFGITFFSEGDSGYFCSNRPGGVGNDDIYFFKSLIIPVQLEVLVLDSITEKPLDSVIVKIAQTGKTGNQDTTDAEGKIKFSLIPTKIFKITAAINEYFPKTIKLLKDDFSKGIPLEKVIRLRKKKYTKGEVVELPEIYYDLDKATLRPESKNALDGLIKTLEDNPNLAIKLLSHTDSRQTDSYNQDLSDRRAKSVVDYLIVHNVAPDRLEWEGRGERDLRISDAKIRRMITKEAKERAHQKNRRTQFEVISTAYVPKN